MQIRSIKTRIFRARESLQAFVANYLPKLHEGDIVVITSKIVALSQGRVVDLADTDTKERWIKKSSREMIRTPWCWLTKMNGEWCANAGVDESNADGRLVLFPSHVHRVAQEMQVWLQRTYRLSNVGVIITDTRIFPMRVGTMGVAVGFAGFSPTRRYIGTSDLFGRVLKHTIANIVHPLAVAAVLAMGEGDESRPMAVIRNAPVEFGRDRTTPSSLTVDPCDDLYRDAYMKGCRQPGTGKNRRRSRRLPNP